MGVIARLKRSQVTSITRAPNRERGLHSAVNSRVTTEYRATIPLKLQKYIYILDHFYHHRPLHFVDILSFDLFFPVPSNGIRI